jgi:repressor LexA
MAKVLYPKERQIMDFLRQYIAKNGYSPTLREIAAATQVTSAATAYEHLSNLAIHGFIKKERLGQRLTIEILDGNNQLASTGIDVSILGYIAAGAPLEPYTDPNATIKISSFLVTDPKSAFVLQVRGESMIEDGILDGDYVVVKYQENAQNGDIVVALLETGLATLKRFFIDKDKGQIKLMPANAKMSPIYATNVRIQGKVIGVIRKYH